MAEADAVGFIAPTFGQRLGGRLVDGLLLLPLWLVLAIAVHGDALWIVSAIVVAGYEIVSVATTGKTIGKYIVGTRVVSASHNRDIRVWQATVRYLVLSAPVAILAVAHMTFAAEGWTAIVILPILRPPMHRGLHDLAARTIVIPTRIPVPR
jgi:uncharacterized RDD family membrane protein YckC